MTTLAPTLLLLLVLPAAPCVLEEAPVKVSVYYETKCPASQKFITNQLYPVWTELKDIIELDVNAYGKANDTASGDGYTFECQHGPVECEGNILMACAKEYIQSEEQFMTFLDCIMTEFVGAAAGELCAQEAGVEFLDIDTCYTSVEGQQLLHQVGLMEAELDPQLTSVPWILIDDWFTKDQLAAAQSDLRKVVCDAYQGETPPGCV